MNKTLLLILCLFGSIVCVNGEFYSDTLSNIHPDTTKYQISWVHTLPSNCTNITSLTIKIKAYDVDKSNYIPVSINGIQIGYLNGGYNNQWDTTTLTPDANTLKQISDTHPSSLTVYVESKSDDWVGVDTSELSIEYVVDEAVLNGVYYDTREEVHPDTTYNPITWTHNLPDNYSKITKMVFIMQAYDVDRANYIPVYVNYAHKLGYLSGGNNVWSYNSFVVSDEDTLIAITNNNTAKIISILVVPDKNDWVGIGNASLSVEYESGTNTHSTYIDSKDDISDTVPNTITWTHELASTENITSITFVIQAHDVDRANYVPVYANNVSLGYLVGNSSYDNMDSITTFEVTGSDIDTIVGNSTIITMRVEPDSHDWVGIRHAEMIVQYDGVIIPNNNGEEIPPVKTPIPLFAIILTIAFMSSIIYYKIK
ncbi:hypothetical protein Mjas_03535 [Methanothermococcus sp. Ax23]|uniref:hypothetical protein n=1 Tax=Methanothermococcus sp. Ax23 TaxID=3156486 RepID=UPI003BA15556